MRPTRDQVKDESAGPRLDGWVAEHVTRWAPSGIARNLAGVPFPEPIPSYSADIAAAWAVVEKMQADGWVFDLSGATTRQTALSWDAGFVCSQGPCERHGSPHDNWHGVTDIAADAAPLAICRAALAAVLTPGGC